MTEWGLISFVFKGHKYIWSQYDWCYIRENSDITIAIDAIPDDVTDMYFGFLN